MGNFKNSLSAILRKTGLLYSSDYLKFFLKKIKNFNRNSQTKKLYPAFIFPPDYFLYETFALDYYQYLHQGKCNANEIIDIISPLINLSIPGKKILDWGCGPARVVRHLPEMLSHKHLIYGTDYNSKYINWCSNNLSGISFAANSLYPPIAFENNYFDFIYSLSILTHLSEKNHFAWIAEIDRLLKPGGILIISTQGSAYKNKMLKNERKEFEKGNIVVRNYLKEGHRIFTAFQPETFMRELLNGFEIITLQKGSEGNSIQGIQDTWVVKKK